ncbi:MAG: hypothetical protein U9P44_00900 [archaeon]|nr:hypothetical protein [archaeon]
MAKPRSEFAVNRIFKDIYVCCKCNTKRRAGKCDNLKCRKCNSSQMRLKNKDRKGK